MYNIYIYIYNYMHIYIYIYIGSRQNLLTSLVGLLASQICEPEALGATHVQDHRSYLCYYHYYYYCY